MSEGLSDLERSLRQLQPTPAVTGPMLFAMGRASALRSIRIWRGVSLVSVLAAMTLGGIVLWRPEPEARVVVVSIPVMLEAKPANVPTELVEPNEPIAQADPTESPAPAWRKRLQQMSSRPEPLSDPTDADGPTTVKEPRPFDVNDFLKGPGVWSSLSPLGDR
jgi:hypothetical protein